MHTCWSPVVMGYLKVRWLTATSSIAACLSSSKSSPWTPVPTCE